MLIKTFVLGLLSNNTYLAINEEKKSCFLVDPSTPSEKIERFILDNGYDLQAILLTHGHFDHIGGVNSFKEKFGCKVYMHADDVEFIDNPLKFGRKFDKFAPDVLVDGNDVICVCDMSIKVLHTPGHSQGSVCYILGDVIFCGDTLFKRSYGRVDLRGGDYDKIKSSIQTILELDGDRILLCGHGESSTTAYERAFNPIVDELGQRCI